MSKPISYLIRGATIALLVVGSAHAQYKWIGTDGTVGYGDRPPPPGARVLAGSQGAGTPAGSSVPVLPYELRTVTQRFPVTLYTTPRCEPCDLGREHLKTRGIPFAERLIVTEADVAALQKLGSSGKTLPALSVGSVRTEGFQSGTWTRLLDAAGFPKSSLLPGNYVAPAARPLSARGLAEGATAKAPPQVQESAAGPQQADGEESYPRTAVVASGSAPFRLPGMPAPATTPESRVRF